MIDSLKDLIGLPVEGPDGSLGTVEDIYFDDRRWRVRYILVHTGEWLEGRRLLLSKKAFDGLLDDESGLQSNLRQERVQAAPPFLKGRHITREEEEELFKFYEWPFYWAEEDEGGIGPGSPAALPLIELASEIREQITTQGALENPDLHSLEEALGATVVDREGEHSGSLADLTVQMEDWEIPYLIVDTGGLLPGKKVQLAPSLVESMEISEDEKTVQLDLERETIHNSPEWEDES